MLSEWEISSKYDRKAFSTLVLVYLVYSSCVHGLRPFSFLKWNVYLQKKNLNMIGRSSSTEKGVKNISGVLLYILVPGAWFSRVLLQLQSNSAPFAQWVCWPLTHFVLTPWSTLILFFDWYVTLTHAPNASCAHNLTPLTNYYGGWKCQLSIAHWHEAHWCIPENRGQFWMAIRVGCYSWKYVWEEFVSLDRLLLKV